MDLGEENHIFVLACHYLNGSFNIEIDYVEASSHKLLIRQTLEFDISFPDVSNIASTGKEIGHPHILIYFLLG